MNEKAKQGFTLVEVLITISISLSILVTLHYIPMRMTQSFKGYTAEVSTNRNSYHLLSAVHEDLRNYSRIEEISDGFIIGESVYTFSEEGVYRKIGNSNTQLVDEPLVVTMDTSIVTIRSLNEEENRKLKRSVVDLTFPRDYHPNRSGGEL